MTRHIKGLEPIKLPPETMTGALSAYISSERIRILVSLIISAIIMTSFFQLYVFKHHFDIETNNSGRIIK